MKIRFFFGFALFFIFYGCSNQVDNNLDKKESYPEYYHLIRQAKRAATEGENHLALQKFEKASNLVSYTHTKNFRWASFIAIKINDCEKALAYYRKAVEQGFEFFKWDYSQFKNCPNWSRQFEQELFASINSFSQKESMQLSKLIDSLYSEDQKRGSIPTKEIREIDSLNILKIRDLIDKYGFPDERLVGEESAKNAFLIMLHFDEDKGNKVLEPILNDALYNGKISPENYGWIVDRRLNWSDEKKEPWYYEMPTKSFFDLTEDQKILIDKRRFEIGLKPLDEINITLGANGSIYVEDQE